MNNEPQPPNTRTAFLFGLAAFGAFGVLVHLFTRPPADDMHRFTQDVLWSLPFLIMMETGLAVIGVVTNGAIAWALKFRNAWAVAGLFLSLVALLGPAVWVIARAL